MQSRSTILSARMALSMAGVVVLTSVITGCERSAPPAKNPAVTASDAIARGDFLVKVGGCNDCHTPFKDGERGPEPDMSRMLSGHPEGLQLPPPPALNAHWSWAGSATNTAYAGPWGISYAINLTPDAETGIGKWSEESFVQAFRTGTHLGIGRPIAPPMPWQAYALYPDADLKAIFAYLKSIPPIVNRVPDYIPPATAKK